MSALNLVNGNDRVKANKRKIMRNNSRLVDMAVVSERKVPKIESMEVTDETTFEKFELERTSTPNSVNICEHCMHYHAKVSYNLSSKKKTC
jgi:erythromycin esterase-like protein